MVRYEKPPYIVVSDRDRKLCIQMDNPLGFAACPAARLCQMKAEALFWRTMRMA